MLKIKEFRVNPPTTTAILASFAIFLLSVSTAYGITRAEYEQSPEGQVCIEVQEGRAVANPNDDPDVNGDEFICEPAAGQKDIGGIFQTITNVLLFLVGAIAVIMLIIGGFRYVVSAGDANAVTGAKNTILYAIVGIVVAFLAFAAVNFVLNRL